MSKPFTHLPLICFQAGSPAGEEETVTPETQKLLDQAYSDRAAVEAAHKESDDAHKVADDAQKVANDKSAAESGLHDKAMQSAKDAIAAVSKELGL